jgi:hypothetical protein
MPRCFELFCESGFQGRQLQILADQLYPFFACESEPCSPFSPGPVNDNEDVAFLLINPMHYDEQRDVVVPSAFLELTQRDLSVLRLSFATKEEATEVKRELIARGENRIPPRMRTIEEVCIAKVADLRSPLEQYGRLLGVFDTALETKRSHASIFTTEAALKTGKLRKIARERVHAVMTRKRVKFAELFQQIT